MSLNRKAMMAITTVSLSVLALSGTLAWVSLSSSKVNTWFGTDPANPSDLTPTATPPVDPDTPDYGTTLHDDFDEESGFKEIYIENWGKKEVFARIKLSEYMEVGEGAGEKNNSTKNKAKSVDGSKDGGPSQIDNLSNWAVHAVKQGDTVPAAPAGNLFKDYWKWEMGGSKYYYPAPKDKRDTSNNGLAYVDSGSPAGLKSSEPGVKETIHGEVVTLDQWNKKTIKDQVGPYWVLGQYGFAYWAQPLKSGEATGLLLKKVTLDKAKLQEKYSEDYYYAINVEAKTASVEEKWQIQSTESDAPRDIDNYEIFLYEVGDEVEKGLIETIANSFQDPLAEANDVEKPANSLTPSVTPTVEPESTATPEPTSVVNPEPTATLEPTPTDEPKPTATPEPTPTDEPKPTATPEPTDEPKPTATPEPTPTDEPLTVNTSTVTIAFTEAGIVGQMGFTISNVITYDSGKGAIENGGKIVAKAPANVKYDNSKMVIEALPPLVFKINVTKEEFDSYAAQKLSGEQLLSLVHEFENPADNFQWMYGGADTPKEFTLQKGFYVIGYLTSRTGNVMDLMNKSEEQLTQLLIPRIGYFEVK